MHRSEIEHLVEKYINGLASTEEEAALQKWYSAAYDEDILIPVNTEEGKKAIRKRILLAISAHIHTGKVVSIEQKQTKNNWYKWVAASLLLAVAGTMFYFHSQRNQPSQKQPVATLSPKENNIKPGSDKAVLTLADGSTIVLDDAKGTIASQGNTSVIKQQDGSLLYNNVKGAVNSKQIQYNTISTPRGGQYHITLPDGTKVWLNAASSLTFPTAFVEKDRKVQLTGEAYFEVEKNVTQPFKVQTGQTLVEVLGTSFNVMAYAEEGNSKTTLVSGAVKLSEGTISATLHPGQQAYFNATQGNFSVKTVDVNEALAWKNGYFIFNRTSMQAVMQQIVRWYDVDVEYKGAIPKDEIVGKIPRSANILDVLHVMELIGIHFKIEGRKVIVL